MRRLVVVWLLLIASPVPVAAATITLTAPSSTVSVPEGDDFFTTVMNNPLDFDVRRDFMWEERFDEGSISATGGIWRGTFGEANSFVFPLFAGFPTALNTGLVGENFPVDTAKYTFVSARSRVSSRSMKAIAWSREVNFPDGTLRCGTLDGYLTNTHVLHPASEFVVDVYNFASSPPAECPSAAAQWKAAPVRAVWIEPSVLAPAGTVAEYDWIRFSDPTSAPLLTISWTTSGVSQTNPVPQVNVYVDTDPAACSGGAFLGRVPHNAGSFTFPTAILPPGTHYFCLKLFDNNGLDTLLASSNSSAPLVVNGKRRISFDNPSMTSGPDYASTVLGNSWDLDDASDIDNLGNPLIQKSFVDESFGNDAVFGSFFTATAVILGPAPESDSQVWLHVESAKPIDTRKFRYLTYQTAIDPTGYGNIVDKVRRGWVVRLVWWNQDIQVDGSTTKDNVVYEGIRSYSIDLALPNARVLAPNDPYPQQSGWRGNPTLRHLRLDPTEVYSPTRFFLLDVKLTGKPEPDPDRTFTIRFVTTDPEGDGGTVSFFLDTHASGCGGVFLGAVAVPAVTPPGTAQSRTFTFSTASLFPADYFICAVVTDAAGNAFSRYADVPMRIPSPFASGLGLGLSLNQTTLRAGDTLRVDATFSNPDDPTRVDVFFGIVLPAQASSAVGCSGGDGVAFFGPGSSLALGCSSDPPQGFPALARNVPFPAPVPPTTANGVLTTQLPAGTPAGTYTVFMLLTPPGALADGQIGPGDVLAVATATFTVVP